jgi:hypothetical protein
MVNTTNTLYGYSLGFIAFPTIYIIKLAASDVSVSNFRVDSSLLRERNWA